MEHTLYLIGVIITISIIGLLLIQLFWIYGIYKDPFGMAYIAKRGMYKRMKDIIKERIPNKLDEFLFLYGTNEFTYPNGSADRISMPNKIDLKPLTGIRVKVQSLADTVACKPLFVRLLDKKKANIFIELYNGTAEGKAILAYTRISVDDGTPFSTFSIFLYSNSDFESLNIDKNDPNSLFSCAYIADFSIVHRRYLTLGESKLMQDYIMEKENKEA